MCGEIIRQYPDDRLTPSCLLLGWITKKIALHIVVGCDNSFIYAITAYYPNTDYFSNDVAEKIESILNSIQKVSSEITVTVIDYTTQAA